LGDFNEILDNSEKYGGRPKTDSQLEGFRNAISQCDLGDLGFRGPRFTSRNHQDSAAFNKERLDSAFTNRGWCDHYPGVMVEVLAVRSSDHNTLWVRFHPDRANRIGPQQFRFEASWNLDSECSKIIQRAWKDEGCGSNSMTEAMAKLDRCKLELHKWSRAKFGQAERTIKQLSTKLQCLQEEEKSENLEKIKQL
jgi:hypothetical protein